MITLKDILLLENRFMIIRSARYDGHRGVLDGEFMEMLPPLAPVVIITEALAAFEATTEEPSDSQTYTVEATNLFGNLRIVAPNGYELSRDGVTWNDTLTIVNVNSVIGTTTIYVRLKSGEVNTYSGLLVHTATGFRQEVEVTGTVAPEITTIKYGLHYNWWATQPQGGGVSIIPEAMVTEGWGISTQTHRNTLASYIGVSDVGGWWTNGGKLKESGTTYWDSPNEGATNDYDLNIRGSGIRNHLTGVFEGLKTKNRYHTATSSSATLNHGFGFLTTENRWLLNEGHKKEGDSIRPVRLATALELDEPDGLINAYYFGNDGKVYRCTKIGTQVWVADNLAETKWSDGNYIQGWDADGRVIISDAAWAALTDAALCVYADDINNL
jgi:hypothetical protein